MDAQSSFLKNQAQSIDGETEAQVSALSEGTKDRLARCGLGY